MKKLFLTPIILFIVSINLLHAQDTTKKVAAAKPLAPRYTVQPAAPVNTDRSLSGQYRYLLSKVYNYQQPVVAAFYKNFNDTLKTTRAQLQKANETVASQKAIITKLTTEATIKDELISSSNAKVDEIKLLGISFTKASYNTLMWGLVIGFGVALAIVIFSTGRYKHEAKYRIKLYEELSEEFQTYKSKANEKEKKLARELQTERNKLDDLLGR
ncbi:MAG: hypothetical protein EOP46_08760 [Sphingobacteriaceae bacterium]|nr:MAG: hypothetical protein EOP46_08760 [Sphingobacteriaceae bacterium]